MQRTVPPIPRALSFAGAVAAALLACGCVGTPPASVAKLVDPHADDGEALRSAPYGPEVAARFPAPAVRYVTPGLAPGRTSYSSNDEVQALLAALAQAPAAGVAARLLDLGASQRGTPLNALHLSRVGAEAARPTVLLIGQQHGDEPAPAEALLVVAQELARGDLQPLLDRIDVVLMPRVNVDGAVPGRRLAANGIDLNRDHLLLRTPEVQAVAALAREFNAAVVVDAHEYSVVGRWLDKFDALQRFDALLQAATIPNLPSAVDVVSEQRFRRPLAAALAREGLTSEWYYTTSTDASDKTVSMGGVRPDIGRNVGGLKNAVSLLIETRGIGIGRLHLMRRVHTHVVAARSVLDSAARDADTLLHMQRDAGAAVSALACRGDATIDAAPTPTRRALTMLDPDTGADRTIVVDWQSALELQTLKVRRRPCGYWLDAEAGEAVARLRRLGLEVRRFAEPTRLSAERWREKARSEGARADVRGTIADGAVPVVHVDVELSPEALAATAGSYYVPLDQPLANLAIAALEPDTQSSYFANRIVDALAHAARVMVAPQAPFDPVP
jgi:hypothetical protein